MNKKIFLILPLFLLLLVSACSEDENNDDMQEMDIVETAIATSDLSSLVEALQATNLVSALEASGPFTVFAPNNAAFQAVLDSDPSWNTITDIPTATLTNILLHHVVSGKVMAADLSDTYVNTLATGPNSENLSLQIAVTGGVTFNGSAMPLSTDVEASNGVVHIIDEVMMPPSIVTFALGNPDFSLLVGALTDARHNGAYLTTVSGAGPFTVFAPNNAAFQTLLDSNPAWTTTADIDLPTLQAVLNYHLVDGANVQSDELTDGQMITTEGGTVTVDLSSGAQIVTTSSQTVNIALVDVQGTNGVIHVVDQVLLP